MTLTADVPSLSRPQPLGRIASYGLSLIYVAVATLGAVLVDQLTDIPNLSLIFVLPVVVAAASFGWGPALVAALGGVAAFNFFLIAPRYSFHVADPSNVWALALLLLTAAVVSAVAAQSRQRELVAREAANQAAALQALARALAGAGDRASIARACADALSRMFQAPAAVLLQSSDSLEPQALSGGAVLSDADVDAARWAVASKLPTRGGAYPVEAAAYDVWPVPTRHRRGGAIAVKLSGAEGGRPAAPERLVEIVAGYLAVALERDDLASQALATRMQAEGERLKTDLLAAVSHDLKTPLSTVLFTLQSLQAFDAKHDAKARADLLSLAETETARLNVMVGKLLDMNRLQADALAVQIAPTAAADLVTDALARTRAVLAGRKLVNEVDGEGPLLAVDATLFESALGNVLENAAKYAADQSSIRVRAGRQGAEGWIEVLDEGIGFSGPIEPLFERFARGVEGDGRPPGVGLGLAIARGFLAVQGGRIEAANRTDRAGARVRLIVPLALAPADA
jgi:K+-sensing histidine kinase KdpD